MTRLARIGRPLVLASASPRRRELLGLLGLVFSARVAQVWERVEPGESPVQAVQRFAREKAAAIARQIHAQSYPIVIGADTIVVLDGEALGKPQDAAEAEAMLRRLRSREHLVYTALSLISEPDESPLDCVACTVVPMRDYSDQEIWHYIRSGDPFDKAGAYAIQNPQFRPVPALSGCYANVMGLPLCHLSRQLQALGVEILVDVPAACQGKLDYQCPVFWEILQAPQPCLEARENS